MTDHDIVHAIDDLLFELKTSDRSPMAQNLYETLAAFVVVKQ